MKYFELAPGIFIYQNVIDGHEEIIESIELSISNNVIAWHGSGVKSEYGNSVNKEIRDTDAFGVPYLGKIKKDPNESNDMQFFLDSMSNIFYTGFHKIEEHYKENFGISTTWHDTYGVLKYGVGQKFINHIDDHTDFLRRVSTVYYINDTYLGGEINFPRFNISYKPSANEMIVFPSTYVYNHSVSEVTEGTRYCVVSWLS